MVQITLGQPKYLLSPAQQITSGPPSKIPEWLGLFKAYEITSSEFSSEVKFGKPVLLCVPTQQWHHEEHTPIPGKGRAFVVYASESRKADGRVSIIDQFGLNRLSTKSVRWLCLPTTLD